MRVSQYCHWILHTYPSYARARVNNEHMYYILRDFGCGGAPCPVIRFRDVLYIVHSYSHSLSHFSVMCLREIRSWESQRSTSSVQSLHTIIIIDAVDADRQSIQKEFLNPNLWITLRLIQPVSSSQVASNKCTCNIHCSIGSLSSWFWSIYQCILYYRLMRLIHSEYNYPVISY